MSHEVDGQWVINTMRVAFASCPDNPAIQLTILTRALAHHGKVLGVSKEELVENFERAYDAENIKKVKQ